MLKSASGILYKKNVTRCYQRVHLTQKSARSQDYFIASKESSCNLAPYNTGQFLTISSCLDISKNKSRVLYNFLFLSFFIYTFFSYFRFVFLF